MKKFIDSPDTLLQTSLQGFAKAHADIVQFNPEPRFVYRNVRKTGKVALIPAAAQAMNRCTAAS